MPDGVEKVGVEAKVEGAQQFLSDLSNMEKAYDKFITVSAKAVKYNEAAGRYQDVASGKFVKFADILKLSASTFDEAGKKKEGFTDNLKETSKEAGFFDGVLRGALGQLGQFGSVAAGAIAGPAAFGAALGSLVVQSAMKAIDVLNQLMSTIAQLVSTMIDFGAQCLQVAGRVDELERSASLLGQRAGYSRGEVDGFLDSLADLGIRADVAATLIAQLSRYQIDLSESTELATVAQNAAVISGIDSSDALERLTYAATTNMVRTARSAEVMADFQQAQENLATSLGITTEALTEEQKVQANFQAILAEGAKIQGVYGAAMESPTKALRSLGREMFNLQAALGAPFLSAWATVIGVMRDFVHRLTEAVQEGGALYPVLVQLGAWASLAADGIAAGATALMDAMGRISGTVIDGLSDIADKALRFGVELVAAYVSGILATSIDVWDAVLNIAAGILGTWGQTAADAFRWGAEIVVQLAMGIIEAASSILIQAINYVSSILASWFGPGSPPRVAPELDEWGAEAMAEYLRGFTEADFSVLSKLESVFQQALGDEGLAGVIDELMTAVSMGEVTDEMFAAIAAGAGEMGDELAELARIQIELAEATERAAAADEAYEAAQGRVSQLTREYNQMLREGATQDELDAKKAQIDAARDAQEAAKNESQAAKTGLDDLEKRAGLQDELVKQLVKLTKLQEKMAEEGGGAGGGGGAAGGGGGGLGLPQGIGIPPGAGFDLGTRIGEAIETAKQNLLALFTGENSPFAPLVDAWNRDILPRLETLKTTLFGGINEIGEPVKGLIPTFQEFGQSVSDAWDTAQTKIEEARLTISTAFENVKLAVENASGPIEAAWLAIQNAMTPVIDFITANVEPVFTTLAMVADTILGAALTFLATLWETILYPALLMVWDFVQISVIPLFESLARLFDAVVGLAVRILAGLWENVLQPALETVYNFIADKVKPIFEALVITYNTSVKPALQNLANIILPALKRAFDAVKSAVQWVIDKINALIDKINSIDLPDWLEPGSPPPLYYALKDIGAAMDELSRKSIPLFQGGMAGFRGAAAGGGPASSTTHQVTTIAPQLNVGPNSFYNGMDVALVESIATNVLRRSLGGVG
jgi:hypothetical protein